jgi:cytochrome c553
MTDSPLSRAPAFAAMLASTLACVPMTSNAAESARQEFSTAVRARPNLDRGAQLFRDCAACHGSDGNGSEDGGVPRIAGQHFRVLVRQLVDYRHETRWDIRMEHYAGRRLLADPQAIADVAGYAARLSRDMPRNVGDGVLVAHGAKVYAQRCAECHGAAGEGDNDATTPRLAGQHYEYLLRQMYDAVDGRRPNFSAGHVRILARLQRDDLVGVADFLARSEWTGPRSAGPRSAGPQSTGQSLDGQSTAGQSLDRQGAAAAHQANVSAP